MNIMSPLEGEEDRRVCHRVATTTCRVPLLWCLIIGAGPEGFENICWHRA